MELQVELCLLLLHCISLISADHSRRFVLHGPIDGLWGPWSDPTACTKTCGYGQTTRHRYCNSPPPSQGGADCSGYAYIFSVCKLHSTCVLNGGWSKWSHWSTCSTSCNAGQITRSRACDNPAPAGGGATCTGNKLETHECSFGPCAAWSHWFDAPCSVSCGNGTRERLRQCSSGRNQDCTGQSYILEPCTGPSCV